MSRLYDHLAEIIETADGGFDMTRGARQYFSRFLRHHGKTLRGIATYAALIDALRECQAADFAQLRRRLRLDPLPEDAGNLGLADNEAQHRLVA